MAVKLLPDVEQMVIDYLVANADVDALAHGRVYSRVPEGTTAASWPMVTVSLAPSIDVVERVLLEGAVDISFWAGSKQDGVAYGAGKAAAHDLAKTCWAVLTDPAFQGLHPGLGLVTGVDTRVGMMWLPDPENGRPRYILQIVVYTRPLRD